MQVSKKVLDQKTQEQLQMLLFAFVKEISESDDSEILLHGFFTPTELTVFSKRLAIAVYLVNGHSYNEIKEELKVSSATVASVSSMLENSTLREHIENIDISAMQNKNKSNWGGFMKNIFS